MMVKILNKITYNRSAMIYRPFPEADQICYKLDVRIQQQAFALTPLRFLAASSNGCPGLTGVTHVGTSDRTGGLSLLFLFHPQQPIHKKSYRFIASHDLKVHFQYLYKLFQQ